MHASRRADLGQDIMLEVGSSSMSEISRGQAWGENGFEPRGVILAVLVASWRSVLSLNDPASLWRLPFVLV